MMRAKPLHHLDDPFWESLDHVILDMDGLLLNTERLALRAHEIVAEEQGLGFDLPFYQSLIGVNHQTGFEIMRNRWTVEEISRFAQRVNEIESEFEAQGLISRMPGVTKLFDKLDELQISRVVATSTARERAKRRLKLAGFFERIDGLICGDEVTNGKPHPEIFLKALGDHQKNRTVVFEDSYNGIRAANRAGIRAIMVPDLLPAPEASDDPEIQPFAVIRSLEVI